jgi:cell division protein FtsB
MEEPREVESVAGFSFKVLFLTTLGIVMLGLYVQVLLFGENSLSVLNTLRAKKEALKQEKKILKAENQRLQKTFFELTQLVPKD